ncbi:MAG: discoidin domain-containing protein [Candidatus Omnitrophota bacterium]
MKRLRLTLMVCLLAMGFVCTQVFAQESLPLTATASSEVSAYHGAAKAVDGNTTRDSCWEGVSGATPWWIMFDTGAVNQIGQITMFWFSSYFAPKDYDIQISSDGTTWENIYTGISGISDLINGETKDINREARYIRLYIRVVDSNMPGLNELMAFGETSPPPPPPHRRLLLKGCRRACGFRQD